MYEAYTNEEIVSKLPIEASSIGSYVSKGKLFIGSRQGHLITCNQNSADTSKLHYEYQVCRTFERRPIIGLQVVESHDLIICLTDVHLSIHDAVEPFKLLDVCSKYKSISAFSHFVTESQTIHIAISARKHLHIFKYLLGELCEINECAPITLPENAQAVVWCGVNNLILAFKCEFQFWDMDHFLHRDDLIDEKSMSLAKSPTKVETIRTESNEIAPLIVAMSGLQIVAIRREISTVEFFEPNSGKMITHFNNCKFSDQILSLTYHHPYLIGILPKNLLEIRSVNPPMLIQKIPLLRVSVICPGGSGIVYAASESQIWKLCSERHLQKNIRFLIEEKQFELAAQLAASPTQRTAINRQLAAKHFLERNFSKCFEIHNRLNTDVLLVLNLFPFFIPDKYVAVISRYAQAELQLFEVSSENITENERKRATQALIQFLVSRRAECIALVNQHYLDYNNGNSERILSTNELKRQEASLELIDTVLLKCYIKVNPSMVKSLLRSKNCCCIVSEAEKDLNQNRMFEELLILYEKRKMYRKYLELLQREVKKHETFGIKDIVHFLRRLKRDQMPLILEFSAPILSANIELGVQFLFIYSLLWMTKKQTQNKGAKNQA
ncbi:hypothetical protein niasHS_002412 [Heterodera schachtii]|uniref:CNH domain-containing protein n=1 Tax=Heterodera schachtii TaxID=97005 RepID=A0ABD2KK48_HETSC